MLDLKQKLALGGYNRLTVLERRDRVGGRIQTLDDLPGKPEAGAQVLSEKYSRLLGLADEAVGWVQHNRQGNSYQNLLLARTIYQFKEAIAAIAHK